MHTIFHTTITQIGDCARDALQDDMLITFREGAPADIEAFCFIHRHGATTGELQTGGVMDLAQRRYAITAVGSVATQNLRELGHVTVRFDGESQAEFPGSIHVSGPTPADIPVGSTLSFIA
ncbi:PTS glucitol/sorbitol transporter subunit IIA [Serratia ficaria]|uniref:PTS glucitol/sorbitol transporter subunit IIA n=1 Tax=Serratia ficaria TaxID=61651 RepID=UPI00217C8260|nr:PTS glucitol/sorbitol transporter subunit IIA [Serratia ficaria]CAI2124716.1 PTS system glucitol/sorbitol-specific transporter subunit IIA [Serratia ficaria]